MQKNKYLAMSALGFFLTGCAGMSKNQAALVGAITCGAGGAAGGAAAARVARPGSGETSFFRYSSAAWFTRLLLDMTTCS